MTPSELVETAIRKFPLGSPVISAALAEVQFWRFYPDIQLGRTGLVLGVVLGELPDAPPRTGDCAELLADTPGTESS